MRAQWRRGVTPAAQRAAMADPLAHARRYGLDLRRDVPLETCGFP
jgi:hypothetical protein